MVSLDGSPCVRYGSQDEIVPPYTLTDFMNEITEACKAAWEGGRNEICVIRVPNGMFPNVTECRNPITRSIIKIERVTMFDTGMCVLAVPLTGIPIRTV